MENNLIESRDPFIKLLSSPYHKYVYEVNTNSIYRVDPTIYEALMSPEAGVSEECKRKIEKLKSEGKLLCYHPKNIEHQMSSNLSYYLNNAVRSITLQLTQQCNFRCAYCIYAEHNSSFQRQHSNQRMTLETAKRAIDFLFSHSRDVSHVNIGFYGGEPLLEFELIKRVVDYVKEEYYGKIVTYNITTNGSLFTEEILDFFVENNIHTMISLDGPKNVHDKYRHYAATGNGTYDSVIEKIQFIKEHYPEFFKKLRFSAVVDPQENFDQINRYFQDIQKTYGIMSNISMMTDAYSSEKMFYGKNYIFAESNERIKVLLSCLGYTKDKYSSPITHDYLNQLSRLEQSFSENLDFNKQRAPAGPCIPGTLRLLVDVNGEFYPCEHVSEKSSVMNIGNLIDGFNINNIHYLLNVSKITEESCKNCWAYHHCYQCAKFCDNGISLSKEMRRKQCITVRRSLENKLKNYIMLNEIMEMKNEKLNEKECYSLSI